jgi:hypothetical protein
MRRLLSAGLKPLLSGNIMWLLRATLPSLLPILLLAMESKRRVRECKERTPECKERVPESKERVPRPAIRARE